MLHATAPIESIDIYCICTRDEFSSFRWNTPVGQTGPLGNRFWGAKIENREQWEENSQDISRYVKICEDRDFNKLLGPTDSMISRFFDSAAAVTSWICWVDEENFCFFPHELTSETYCCHDVVMMYSHYHTLFAPQTQAKNTWRFLQYKFEHPIIPIQFRKLRGRDRFPRSGGIWIPPERGGKTVGCFTQNWKHEDEPVLGWMRDTLC